MWNKLNKILTTKISLNVFKIKITKGSFICSKEEVRYIMLTWYKYLITFSYTEKSYRFSCYNEKSNKIKTYNIKNVLRRNI